MREYNAERPSCERSAQQLRNCWKKLKQQTRKNLANDKVFVYVCANDLILLFIFLFPYRLQLFVIYVVDATVWQTNVVTCVSVIETMHLHFWDLI